MKIYKFQRIHQQKLLRDSIDILDNEEQLIPLNLLEFSQLKPK